MLCRKRFIKGGVFILLCIDAGILVLKYLAWKSMLVVDGEYGRAADGNLFKSCEIKYADKFHIV